MSQAEREPKPLLPSLQSFYDLVIPFTWPLVRFGVAWPLIVHGWGKIMRGMARQAEMLVHDGITLGIPFAVFLTVIEFVGGICILLGLFTRFWAAAVAIEMGYLTFIHYWHNGFSWLNRGYEFVLLWGIVSLAIALRGGGPYSLDRKIGREL
ncbi:MAG TPA: DoxX family protein [Xanthobacteraceae bacterium]|jgi:putative oxidoreductase|nr:DoxX family protein [Xanthobacteraceae bacterium]